MSFSRLAGPSAALIGMIFALISIDSHASFSGYVRAASDFVQGAYSKSDENPVLQADLVYSTSQGWYSGVWMSKVSISTLDVGTFQTELVPYFGRSWALHPEWTADIGASYYFYGNGDGFHGHVDYTELSVKLRFRDTFTVRADTQFDVYNQGEHVHRVQLQLRYPFSDVLDCSAALGYEAAKQVYEYDFGHLNVGATWFPRENLAIDLRYHTARYFNELDETTSIVHSLELHRVRNRFVVSVSLGF